MAHITLPDRLPGILGPLAFRPTMTKPLFEFMEVLMRSVLIAAAFCMFNRYVDGLDTWAPHEREFYVSRAKQFAEEGHTNFNPRP